MPSGGGATWPLPRGLRPRHEGRVDPLQHDGPVDHALAHVAAAGQLVHEVEQHLFEDGAQPASPRAPQQRLVGDGLQGVVGELELDVLELEDLPVLLDEGVLRLDQDALIRILGEPKNALVKQYRKFFELEDVELEFTEDALAAVADQALLRGTGARGLRAILEEVLLNVMYDLPSRSDVERCVIDQQVVLDKVNPTLVPRDDTPRQQRPRRAAS